MSLTLATIAFQPMSSSPTSVEVGVDAGHHRVGGQQHASPTGPGTTATSSPTQIWPGRADEAPAQALDEGELG